MKGMKQYESNLVKACIRILNKINCSFVEKRHAGPYRKGKADITGALNGLRFEFELKVGNNKLSLIQKKWLTKCKQAGCLCAGIWNTDELKWIIKNYKRYISYDAEKNQYIELPLDSEWRLLDKYYREE